MTRHLPPLVTFASAVALLGTVATEPLRASSDAAAKPAADTVAVVDSQRNKAAVSALIQALTRGKEYQALEILRSGADPNGRDQSGFSVLNWAVLTCTPGVVQALLKRKADTAYERTPGQTVMKDAAACPAAEKILRAAGAR